MLGPFQSTKERSWSFNDKLNHIGDLGNVIAKCDFICYYTGN